MLYDEVMRIQNCIRILCISFFFMQSIWVSNSEIMTKPKLPPKKYSPLGINYFKSNFKFKYSICEIHTCTLPIPEYKPAILQRVPRVEGMLITSCGDSHVYLSHRVQVTGRDAWHNCCKLGMVPLTIETCQQLRCLKSALMNQSLVFPRKKREFTTAYYDHDLSSEFRSCPDKKPLPQECWKENQPNNDMGMQSYMAVNMGSNYGFNDISFVEPLKLACEKKLTKTKINKEAEGDTSTQTSMRSLTSGANVDHLISSTSAEPEAGDVAYERGGQTDNKFGNKYRANININNQVSDLSKVCFTKASVALIMAKIEKLNEKITQLVATSHSNTSCQLKCC